MRIVDALKMVEEKKAILLVRNPITRNQKPMEVIEI